MFCTECGQPMADEAKFCAYCGTRRVTPQAGKPAPSPSAPEQRVEVQPGAPTPAPARAIRSTAEIMPNRLRPTAPSPSLDAPLPEPESLSTPDPATEWQPEVRSAPLFASPEPGPPPPVREFEHDLRTRTAEAEPVYPPAAAPVRYGSVPFAAEPGSHDVVGARRKISPVLVGAIIVAVIALAGIVWMVRSSMSVGGKAAAPVTITIYPTSAKVAPGKGVDFVSEVSGAPSSDVTWTVEEGDSAGTVKTRGASAKADTISLYCTYTAPQKPGTYHLTATSTADKSKSASAEITVAAK